MASSGGAGLWRAGASHTLFFPLVARQINSRNTSPGELPGTQRALESSLGRFSAGCTTPTRSRHERGRLRVGLADDPIGDDSRTRPVLADSFIREFSDGAVPFERAILDDSARRHNLDSEAEWGHR
jgi:hypothetical protein